MKKIMNMFELLVVVICVCLLVVIGYLELVYIEIEKDGVMVVDVKNLLVDVFGIVL